VILSEIEARIKSKIESIGTPLKNWEIQINYGIKTGFNEAFIIDRAKRDELLKNCPEADEIIRPILRGRDIKKYNAQFANQWIINTHNGIREKNISPVDVKQDYPVVYNHLSKYEDALSKRLDKGQHWSNLRNCAYLESFESEKIVWIELTDHPNFALDKSAFYLNNTIFFMTGDHLKYLLAFLNSRLCEWYFDKIAATSGAGTRRWIKMYIDQICVPFPDEKIESKITGIVDSLNETFDLKLYKSLDNEIYDIFKLSSEEIDLLINASL
jgi:adenine-specific DNA-methyltransferase